MLQRYCFGEGKYFCYVQLYHTLNTQFDDKYEHNLDLQDILYSFLDSNCSKACRFLLRWLVVLRYLFVSRSFILSNPS